MLYDCMFILFGIYVVCSPFIMYEAFKRGLRVGQKPEEEAEKPMFELPKRHKKVEVDPYTARNLAILQNIDAYDGTSNGQRKIGE